MSPFSRVIRAIPETYALNIPQMFHMVVLAGFVPWHIGVENYGRFAALIAIPGLVQSFFEAFCVSILLRYGRKDMLDRPILVVVLPIVAAFVIAFFLLLTPVHALLASAMTVFLFCRSFAFALAVSSGILTRELAMSEGLILVCYVGIALLGIPLGIRDFTLPMIMVVVACAVSSWYLLRAIRTRQVMTSDRPGVGIPPLPLSMALRAVSARAYEDGSLTLSPLVLALTVSPAMAGQFRIFVSAIKVAYKLFPFRYEVVMRDVTSGRQAFRALAIACTFYAVGSVLISVAGFFMIQLEQYGWLLPLVAVSGAVVSCLSMYPVSSMMSRRLPLCLLIGLAGTYFLSSLLGTTGFVIGFSLTSYFVMVGSLIIIKKSLMKTSMA